MANKDKAKTYFKHELSNNQGSFISIEISINVIDVLLNENVSRYTNNLSKAFPYKKKEWLYKF
jgi:transcriptional regulator of met regulon